jgi:hypothetical protein
MKDILDHAAASPTRYNSAEDYPDFRRMVIETMRLLKPGAPLIINAGGDEHVIKDIQRVCYSGSGGLGYQSAIVYLTQGDSSVISFENAKNKKEDCGHSYRDTYFCPLDIRANCDIQHYAGGLSRRSKKIAMGN